MSNVETFRPRSNYLLAFIAFFAISNFTYINILDYGFSGGSPSVAWGLFASSLFYLIFIHPKVIFADEGLIIVNPLNKIAIGWQEISEIDARFTMYAVHSPTGAKIHAFAAQAPGRYHSRNIHPNEIKGLRLGNSNTIRAGESPRSNSGAAIAIARMRSENFGRVENIVGLKFDREINILGIAITSALLSIAVMAQLLHS